MNYIIKEFQKLYEQTPVTQPYARARIISGLKKSKRELAIELNIILIYLIEHFYLLNESIYQFDCSYSSKIEEDIIGSVISYQQDIQQLQQSL
jgi:hypothetical protein